MTLNLKWLFLIFLILVVLDKGITFINVKQFQKNFPEAAKIDQYKIEKNPLAKWFFEKMGLLNGTLVYIPLSVATLALAFFLLTFIFRPTISLYILVMIYGLVIANNFYFMFKFGGMIP